MADTDEKEQADESVLVAWVTVHLDGGESFELLPFEDANDVKSKVSSLIGDWSKSGFLVRGSHIYPWHRVKLIEATKVEELSRGESKRRLEEWQARDLARLQQSFWKTRKPREKKEGDDQGGKEGNRAAA